METIKTHPEHEFARFTSDYELYTVGSYDDNSGKIDSYPPSHILNFNQLNWEESPVQGAANEAQQKTFNPASIKEAIQ